MSVGEEDLVNIVTFFDGPHPKGMRRVSMPCIKDDMREKIQDLACVYLAEGLVEKIRLTLEEKHKEWEDRRGINKFPGEEALTYNEWRLLPPEHAKKCVAIIASSDIGWQHCELCLLSGHVFMIGA
eukprot:9516569-Ditylum_brightwellii.AAC.1